MNEEKFYVPKPKLLDFGTISILIPVIVSSLGLFLMSVEAMVFVQFKSLPENMRFYVSIASAFFMAFGGEVGTISNTVEVFRKYIQSKMSVKFEWEVVTIWDWTGLGVSAAATLLAMFIASSTRPDNITDWTQIFSEWLIIPLMIVAVGDVYAGMMELGLRLGTFELRMREWIVREEEWRQQKIYEYKLEQSNLHTKVLPQVEEQVADDNLKCWCGALVASFEDYNQHLELHKSEARKFDSLKDAQQYFLDNVIEDADFALPSPADIAKWRA